MVYPTDEFINHGEFDEQNRDEAGQEQNEEDDDDISDDGMSKSLMKLPIILIYYWCNFIL